MAKKKIVVIDAETDPFKHGRAPQPFVWGYYDGISFQYFTSTVAFIDFVSKQHVDVYAHNGGKFDYHFLLEFADPDQNILIINGRVSKFKIGKATFYDSYNILPVPLSAFQKDIIDYDKFEVENRIKYWDEIIKYLKGDCIYLWREVSRFIDEYGRNITLASAAFKQWQSICKIKPPMYGESHYDEYHPFYYGGRVSPFKSGVFKGDFKLYDINSAYPRAMMEPHPIGDKVLHTKRIKDSMLKQSLLTVDCFSEGAFPLRKKSGGLDFPIGQNTFHITGWEFISALKTNTIKNINIKMGYVFSQLHSFQPYVDKFFALKRQCEKVGDKAGRLHAKLFLNSLYGKFASNPNGYDEYVLLEIEELTAKKRQQLKDDGFCSQGSFGNLELYSKKLEAHQKKFYNVVTAASITGYVRAYLWESLCAVDDPYYCDTDSIICKDGSKLPMSDKLGDWSLEMEGSKLAIAGKKLYCMWNGSKTKTASKGARLSPKEIETVANGGTVLYRSDAPTYSVKKQTSFCERKIKRTT